MHEHIKDVTRRFAREGFLSITFEPYAREGGVLHLPASMRSGKWSIQFRMHGHGGSGRHHDLCNKSIRQDGPIESA